MNIPITEEQHSLTLNDNTVLIQDYNNLDYSDEYESGGSSQQHSLSRKNREQLQKVEEMSKISKKIYLDEYLHHHHSKKKQSDHRQFRDLQSKYDFGVSPSTKEEYSLLNPQPRLSGSNRDHQYHSKHRNHPREMPSLNEQSSEPEEEDNYNIQPSRTNERPIDHRKRDNKSEIKQFDINSFLNAQPIPQKNKKGISVLAQKHRIPEKKVIRQEREEDSIVLMTLPENQSLYRQAEAQKKRNKAIQQCEKQLQQISYGNDRRFKQVRLNFINTFLPQRLKPKNNPYNMLKYISSQYEM